MKNKRFIGYVMMSTGLLLVLLLLTVVIFNQNSENRQYQSFVEDPPILTQEKKEWITHHEQSMKSLDAATTDPFVAGGVKDVLTPFGEDVIAYVNIPKINLVEPIRIGASEKNLELGAAQVSGTDLPFGGESKRSVIAAHRSWYTGLRFMRINELTEQDLIYVILPDKILTYQVIDQQVIDATDWQQLVSQEGMDLLTLLTCDPIYPPFNHRLLVNAKRVPDVQQSHIGEKLSEQVNITIQKNNGGLGVLLYSVVILGWILLGVLLYKARKTVI